MLSVAKMIFIMYHSPTDSLFSPFYFCFLLLAVEDWPYCDFLISFFSNGFPLDKAIAYTKLHNPFLVNSLEMQILLWDRRLVLSLLDKAGVPTPKRLTVSRDGGAKLPEDLAHSIEKEYDINVNKPEPEPELSMPDDDTIQVNGQTLQKPFVEKPVDGENHNINIYYDTAHGGGGRRLFRKVRIYLVMIDDAQTGNGCFRFNP